MNKSKRKKSKKNPNYTKFRVAKEQEARVDGSWIRMPVGPLVLHILCQ